MAQFVIDDKEISDLERNANVADAIREFTQLLLGRTQDLPHRFKAPKRMAEYMEDWGVNQIYQQFLHGSNSANPLILRFTTRPTQHILEIEFDAADGSRLFTLEIEYGV